MTAYAGFMQRLATLPAPRVIELGTLGWNGRPPVHHRQAVVTTNPAATWLGTDIEPGPGVDVVCDAHHLAARFAEEPFDAFMACSTFEHFRRPWIVAAELAKIVKPGGIGFVQTHQAFPLHGYPSDYFRFSLQAMAELFSSDIGWQITLGEYRFPAKILPLTNLGPGGWNFEAESWLNVEVVVERLQ